MKANISKQEKVLRMTFGIMVIGYGISQHNIFFMLGILPVLSGMFSWCPLYALDKSRQNDKIKL